MFGFSPHSKHSPSRGMLLGGCWACAWATLLRLIRLHTRLCRIHPAVNWGLAILHECERGKRPTQPFLVQRTHKGFLLGYRFCGSKGSSRPLKSNCLNPHNTFQPRESPHVLGRCRSPHPWTSARRGLFFLLSFVMVG